MKQNLVGKIFGIALVFVMVGAMLGGLPVLVREAEASAGTIWVPDNYTTIQAAVNNATSGDTIIVRDGTYHENVDVNTANLTIKSQNGTANCVVSATNSSDYVFNVAASWVNITGFTVENATGTNKAGIYLANGVNHCNISSNNATNNYLGIFMNSSSNNTLDNNTCSNNSAYGIYLTYSSNNTLTNNTANSNTYCGISLDSSSNNTLTNNTAWNNTDYGIHLYYSSNNTLTNNTANLNSQHGIYLYYSSNNTIYNNYFNNTNNAYDNGNNTWNTTNTTGPNIVGGPYLGGNYWSDYTGNDTNGDGFGNTKLPYNCTGGITHGGDYLPLIMELATLEGHVTFAGRGAAPNDKWIESFVVKCFAAGTSNLLWTTNATTNDTGVFTITGLTPGTYDIGIKNWTCLSEKVAGVMLSTSNTTVVDFGTTREGDSNNDDWITGADRSILYTDWGKTVPPGTWHADFNRDGWLTGADRSFMYSVWGQHGDLVG
jgi:parallel beta-helix repeat protein